MSKKLVWLLGLAIVLTLGFFVYWMVERPWSGSPSSKIKVNHPVLGDCEKEQFPFACYLDKAMEAGDPDLCHDAGMDKRDNCLTAYAEIKGIEVDCGKLQDPIFRMECQQAFQKLKDMAAQGSPAETPPIQSPTGTLDISQQAGLKVDKK